MQFLPGNQRVAATLLVALFAEAAALTSAHAAAPAGPVPPAAAAAELARVTTVPASPTPAAPLRCVRLVGTPDAMVAAARLASALSGLGIEVIVDLRGFGAPSWPIATASSVASFGGGAAGETLLVRVETAYDPLADSYLLASLRGPALAASPPVAAEASPIDWEGQLRYRYETRSVLDYRLPGTFKRPGTQRLDEAGDVSIMRTRLGASLALARGVRGYFNLQDARVMGVEGSPGGVVDNVDLFLAYVDLDSLGGAPVSIRAGRQVLTYGDGRIVSGADWGNAGRGYGGARLRYAPRAVQADAFVAWINEGRASGQDRLLAGADVAWRVGPALELEGYHFARSFGDTGFVSESGRRGGLHDGTTGARLRATHGRFDARLESAVQRGHRAGDDVRSWFAVGRLSAELPLAWKPRALAEHSVASGDHEATDGRVDRFDPVYWGGHSYLGALDIVNESNVRTWMLGLGLQPRAGWTVLSEWHDFTLAEAGDLWADAGGNTLRHDPAGAAGRDLGRELDVSVRADLRPGVSLLTGYSRFWPGTFVASTGGGAGLDWGYVQLAVVF